MPSPIRPIWRVLALACLLAVGVAPASAQAPVWALRWGQPGAPLADVQTYLYTLRIDTQAPIALAPTCVAGTPVACQAPLPALTSGPHTLVLTAANAFGSTSSAPLSGAPPGAPIAVSVTVTVTVP